MSLTCDCYPLTGLSLGFPLSICHTPIQPNSQRFKHQRADCLHLWLLASPLALRMPCTSYVHLEVSISKGTKTEPLVTLFSGSAHSHLPHLSNWVRSKSTSRQKHRREPGFPFPHNFYSCAVYLQFIEALSVLSSKSYPKSMHVSCLPEQQPLPAPPGVFK